MSPALSGSSAIRRFEGTDAIEICDGITFEFYTGLPHISLFSTAVSCGALSNPTNGQVSTTGTTFGETATYSCDTGYNLDGGSTRTCEASGATGVWSGSAPTCQRMLLFFIEFVKISNNVHFFRVLHQKLMISAKFLVAWFHN